MDMSKLPHPESSVKKMFDMSDRNILITGGSGYLGLHFAEAVSEMGGFPILLSSDNDEINQAVEKLNNKDIDCASYIVDITNSETIIDAVKDIKMKYNSIDVLINAAAFAMKNLIEGGKEFFDPFEEYKENLWQVMLDVNLTGTFLVTQAVGKIMKKQKKGSIINIASVVAMISPDHRTYKPNAKYNYKGVSFNTPISYPVTKAGLLAFTKYLATYWAKDGIRVNSISPSGVYRGHDKKFVEQLAYRIPLGRMAFPEELKGGIVFLASDASSYITGENLVIDGGYSIW